MSTYTYRLFADYSQFYLQDEGAAGDLSDAWTDEAVADLVALAPGTIGVGTVRNTFVPVKVQIVPGPPPLDLDEWDHIVECDIDVPTGRLVIAGCTDYLPDAARIELDPGQYRARITYGGLDTLSENGLEGDDRYHLALWKASPGGKRILKRHPPYGKRAV
jgi:hypothetical protein